MVINIISALVGKRQRPAGRPDSWYAAQRRRAISRFVIPGVPPNDDAMRNFGATKFCLEPDPDDSSVG